MTIEKRINCVSIDYVPCGMVLNRKKVVRGEIEAKDLVKHGSHCCFAISCYMQVSDESRLLLLLLLSVVVVVVVVVVLIPLFWSILK